MRKSLRKLIPSMYHRRLCLLMAAAVMVVIVLSSQLALLTVVQGDTRRSTAESALTRRSLIPTSRGQILDRRGRVLAVDQASHDVSVQYSVLTGDWARKQARLQASRENPKLWRQLTEGRDEKGKQQLAANYQAAFDEQIEQLWQTLAKSGQLTREDIEKRVTTIKYRVQRIYSSVWRSRLNSNPDKDLIDVARPVAEQIAYHPIVFDVDSVTRVDVSRRINEAVNRSRSEKRDYPSVWEHVQIKPSRSRRYPMESIDVILPRDTLPTPLRRDEPLTVQVNGVGIHLLGGLRHVWKEDIETRPFSNNWNNGDLGGYLPGDRIGSWGIEKAYEATLRGLRGAEEVNTFRTGGNARREPVAGDDVKLSIDILLQARLQALLNNQPVGAGGLGLTRSQPWHQRVREDPLGVRVGDPLNAAAVVIEVKSGEVLAAVSIPFMNRDQLRDDPQSVFDDMINQPFLNRAVSRAMMPGSTVKPLVLAGGITDRKVGYDSTIDCKGYFGSSPNHYRCWIYKQYDRTHGPLAGPEAVARSCNVYFFTLGRRLDLPGLVKWYDRFGLGRLSGSGLAEEVAGILPDVSAVNGQNSATEATYMGIGQGKVSWTPLQAANAYATLARGGQWMSASFLTGVDWGPRDKIDTGLDPKAVKLAKQGLYEAANERHGASNRISMLNSENVFNIEGVKIYGKSGTAQGAPLRIDSDGDEKITGNDKIVRRGDHAWYLAMVQRQGESTPAFTIAVVVEYAGSGTAVSGPIVNQILHALRVEGYL